MPVDSTITRLNENLDSCLEILKMAVAQWREPCELAFYGGTFTLLADQLWDRCLNFAHEVKNRGLIAGFRCSTRPDALDGTRLKEMALAGCQTVELGIQSFNPVALDLGNRGYSEKIAMDACATVLNAGFKLGVQLMPGMPGSSVKSFRDDVRLSLRLGASILRYYPCVVIDGTPLASIWRQGRFTPWSINMALWACAQGWLEAELNSCRVIRMGLAPQAGLLKALLAGPYHPAFGSRAMGYALYLFIKSAGGAIDKLYIPKRTQGHFWGWRGELRKCWQQLLPLKNIIWHGRDEIWIEKT